MINLATSYNLFENNLFPKLYIGTPAEAFKEYLKRINHSELINSPSNKDELLELIETFSNYKNYMLPIIIDDISIFNNKEQSLLLKFIDDSNLNIVLLASIDNVLNTIISRVRDFKKSYNQNSLYTTDFKPLIKARELINNELANLDEDNLSLNDKLNMYIKYNAALSYNDELVKYYAYNDKRKLLSLLEYS